MDKAVVAGLNGFDKVTEWFGNWPSFHDAEIVSAYFARAGESILRIYPYYPQKTATVDFILQQVTDMELADFSPQNVISCLEIAMATDQNGETVYRLTLGPCYGLAGWINAKLLRFQLSPGKSPDDISLW